MKTTVIINPPDPITVVFETGGAACSDAATLALARQAVASVEESPSVPDRDYAAALALIANPDTGGSITEYDGPPAYDNRVLC